MFAGYEIVKNYFIMVKISFALTRLLTHTFLFLSKFIFLQFSELPSVLYQFMQKKTEFLPFETILREF